MKISIGCDHGGYELKEFIKESLINDGIEVCDVGTYSSESVDFPIYASGVCKNIQSNKSDLGILCCGTGIGMSIVANKYKGIRAAVVSDCFSAKATREHNNTNVICLGERVIGKSLALKIVEEWISAKHDGERHKKRLAMVDEIERTNMK